MKLSYSRYGCECDQLNPNQQFSPLFWKLWKFKRETRTTAGKNECEAKKCFWKVLSVLCVKGHFFFPFEWMRYGAYKQGKWIIIVYVEWTRWPYECWNSFCHDFVQHSTRAEHIWYGAKRKLNHQTLTENRAKVMQCRNSSVHKMVCIILIFASNNIASIFSFIVRSCRNSKANLNEKCLNLNVHECKSNGCTIFGSCLIRHWQYKVFHMHNWKTDSEAKQSV